MPIFKGNHTKLTSEIIRGFTYIYGYMYVYMYLSVCVCVCVCVCVYIKPYKNKL